MRRCFTLEVFLASIRRKIKVRRRTGTDVITRSASVLAAPVLVCALLVLAIVTSASRAAARPSRPPQSQSSNSPAQTCNEARSWMETAAQLHAQKEQSSIRAAIDNYNQALACWQLLKARQESADTLRALGDIYFETGKYEAAVDSYRRSITESSLISDNSGAARSLVGLGLVHAYLQDFNQSLKSSADALSLADKLHDQDLRAKALTNYALAYLVHGDFPTASRYIDEAVKIAEPLKDVNTLARALLVAGFLKNNSGHLNEALTLYQRALALWQGQNKLEWQSRALSAIGGVYVMTGEPQKGLNYNDQALAMQRQLGDRRTQAITFNNIGYAYESFGDARHALDNYLQALDCYRELNLRVGIGQTLLFVGDMYRVLGDLEKARRQYDESKGIADALRDPAQQALCLAKMGLLSQARGDLRGAVADFRRSLALYKGRGYLRDEVTVRNNLGYALSLLGERRLARLNLLESLRDVDRINDRELEVFVRHNLARLYRDDGELDQARAEIEAALRLVESFRVKLARFELRSSYFATARQHYELLVDILLQMHRRQPAGKFDEQAFDISERARARSLMESLQESEMNLRADADADFLNEERGLQQQLDDASVRRARLSTSPGPELDSVVKEIDQLTTRYQELQARMRTNNARYATLPPPQPISLKDSQRLLDDDSMLLEYMLGDERSYLWVATSSQLHIFDLPPRSQIESMVSEYRQLLIANQPIAGETYEQTQARISGNGNQIWNYSTKLGQVLLGPIAANLNKKRLLIVIDGGLQSIPFQTLVIPDPNGVTISLVDRHEIIYQPSVSTLQMVKQTAARRQSGSGSVAVFANPVFDAEDPRVKSPPTRTETDTKQASQAVQQALRDVGLQDGRIPPLPASREEADAIISLVPWRTGLKVVDFQASRNTITQNDLSHYRIVHFATHGFVDYQHPELSGLVLSMVDETGNPQDGFLRMHDIYNLKLPVDLVVLSSCNSGLGKDVKGEGFIGLTRGFMYAGASGVVASLWKVDDDATAELMKHFYAGMFQQGLPPAAALRHAQMTLRSQKRWQSPYYWAAFVIQGEYNQRAFDRSPNTTLVLAAICAGVLALTAVATFIIRWKRKKLIRIE